MQIRESNNNTQELPIIMHICKVAYLSNMLAHQKEVIPVPSGDCVVHNGARGWIFKTSIASRSILEHKTTPAGSVWAAKYNSHI
jgi:hypothetical protein